MTARPSVVVSGYYGYGNAGDEAVLEAILEDFGRECPGAAITVLSADPEKTVRAYGIRSVHRFRAGQVWSALRSADLLVSGGGSLLQDVTSTRSLWYYLGVMIMARAAGAKVMVYANGLGPLCRPLNRALAASVLRGVDRITVRDPQSLEVLRDLGVRRPDVLVTADPAFGLRMLPPEGRERLLGEIGLDLARGPVFGLALRPWPGWGEMAAATSEAVARHAESAGGQVLILPMQYSRDSSMAATAEMLPAGLPVAVAGAGRELGAKELRTLVGCCAMLVGMRLHALVFAAAAGVPFVGLAYDPKVAAFVRYLLSPEAAGGVRETGPLAVSNPGEVSAAVGTVWSEREAIGRVLAQRSAELRSRAKENARAARELLGG